MSAPMFPEYFQGKILRLTRNVLATWTNPDTGIQTLLKFFGNDGIVVLPYAELAAPLPAPLCAISPFAIEEPGQIGVRVEAVDSLQITILLPRTGAQLKSVSPPASPSAVAADGPGALTVVRRYALTGYTAQGESYGSELSLPVTLTAQNGLVTIPTGTGLVGRRLWATKTGGTCAFWHSIIPDNATTTFVDYLPDSDLGDEILPEEGLSYNLAEEIKRALVARQTLEEFDMGEVDATLHWVDKDQGVIDPNRNQWVKKMFAVWTLPFDATTRQSIAGGQEE